MPLLVLAALIPLVIASPTSADGCTGNELTAADMLRCAGAEYSAADIDLDAAYDALMSNLDAPGRALLKKTERSWIAYRDSECAFEADSVRGGSMSPLIEVGCRTRLTKQRTTTLHEALALRLL